MTLTSEQQIILSADGNLSISAVAGSGKTTTVLHYARTRPPGSRILYLAYNRSVKTEAVRRFAEMGLSNVRVETAHSLAYGYVVPGSRYAVHKEGYKPHDIVQMLNIPAGPGERHTEYVIARHILSLVTAFCNSAAARVADLNYAASLKDAGIATVVKTLYPQIERGAREFLAMMYRAQVPITHDFYLKAYQLSKPWLPYDVILFDEGQDASPAMTDVFMNQHHATRVIVGDVHQQIYGWRGAHNAMAEAGFQPLTLSQSFRFGEEIARLAADVLDWKGLLQAHTRVGIVGASLENSLRVVGELSVSGKDTDACNPTPSSNDAPTTLQRSSNSKAVLARTNLGLLVRAIEAVEEGGVKRLYFEGNINSYVYADDGASIWDVLALYNGQRGRIRDPLIRAMKDLEELEEYIEKTDDRGLGMMVEVVKKYGARLPAIIKKLKDAHVPDGERHTAECIFSTVHRAKGMEYDTVELAPDFISEKGIEKEKEEAAVLDVPRICEEINLLYVAVTRAKKKLIIPDFLRPKNFPDCAPIEWVKKSSDKNVVNTGSVSALTPAQRQKIFGERPEERKSAKTSAQSNGIAEGQSSILRSNTIKAAAKPMSAGLLRAQEAAREKAKAYDVEKVRETHAKAYAPWNDEQDRELLKMYEGGESAENIASYFGRTRGAIQSRLKRLMGDV